MKTNEQINTVSNTRYLVIMHGENTATIVNTPFTSSKMDIYHQMRNLRVKAGKVGQVVLHEFYDMPEECYDSLVNAYENRLWLIDHRDGKNWDNLYKELLNELAGYKPKREPKQKKGAKKDTPTVDPIAALEAANTEPTNILPGGDAAINDPEEPEMVTVPIDDAETAIPTEMVTPERDADGDRIVKLPKPEKKATKPTKKAVAKKDTKKGKK
jgi:hypothetical protein